MEFQFDKQLQAQAFIEIPQIGEFGLEAYNDEGQFFYVFIKTVLGETYIATCGPVVPDLDLFFGGFCITFSHMPYVENKLEKFINFFLNDKGKRITGAKIISLEDAANQFKDIGPYLNNLIKGIVN